MYKKIRFPQEISAASGLLRAWGILRDGEHLPDIMAEEVVSKYAADHLYNFGKNLFEHLAMAATLPNTWTFSGPTSAMGACSELEKFLYATTVASQRLSMEHVRKRFNEIARRVSEEYGIKIKYRSEMMPLQNVQNAETTEADLWAAKESVSKRRA